MGISFAVGVIVRGCGTRSEGIGGEEREEECGRLDSEKIWLRLGALNSIFVPWFRFCAESKLYNNSGTL